MAVNSENEEETFNHLIPALERMTKSYFALKWLSRRRVSERKGDVQDDVPTLAFVEGGLSSLNLSSKAETLRVFGEECMTVSKLFLTHELMKVLAEFGTLFKNVSIDSFSRIVPYTISMGSLMLSAKHTSKDTCSVQISQFLFEKSQVVQLEQFIRLLTFKSASLQYLLALTYMQNGEYYKAKDLFLIAAVGIRNQESFLIRLISTYQESSHSLESNCTASNLISYFMHVMRLFEQYSVQELLVFFAETALVNTNLPEHAEHFKDSSDDRVPVLWSNIFKYTLEMGQYGKAYSAIIANPDSHRKKDCLSRFVVVLCERQELETLCQLPYIGMQQDVENALLWKARTVDVEMMIDEDAHLNYYNFLYAFHTHRGNYRQASAVMLEFGQRLSLESTSHLSSLQTQAKCYLSSINALTLVSKDSAWIMIPCATFKKSSPESAGMSPKRKYDDENGDAMDSLPGTQNQFPKSNFKLYKVDDIRNLYHLALAELRLAQKEQLPYVNQASMTANEVLSLLVQSYLYESAFSICSKFKIDCDSIFEAISLRCAQLSLIELGEGSALTVSEFDLDWIKEALKENDCLLDSDGSIGKDAGYNMYTNFTSGMSFVQAKELAWKVLYMYLCKFDTSEVNYKYHRIVVSRLLANNPELKIPVYILRSFCRVNPGELLRIYSVNDRLEDGAKLLLDMMDAVEGTISEGHGQAEDLGFYNSLCPTKPSVLMPYSAINEFLSYSRPYVRQNPSTELASLLKRTEERLNNYFDKVKSTSEAMEILQQQ